MDDTLEVKSDRVRTLLGELGGVAVAFSGGIDSMLLLDVAHEVLGDRVLAVTARPNWVSTHDRQDAEAFCRERGIAHAWIEVAADDIEGFAANPPDRCYRCKKVLFSAIGALAESRGLATVVDGSNVDDAGSYRPGIRALAELGIRSPLREAGFTKCDVRAWARQRGIAAWNKPSAACLATRIAYGERITDEKLGRIDAAEDYLRGLGFGQLRVRVHGRDGKVARIEVPAEEVARVAQDGLRQEIVAGLKRLGFVYVALDLDGFCSGSGDALLQQEH